MSDVLHRLVDELPEEELPEAERVLEALASSDPVARSLALAPLDDEPETDEEREAVRAALDDLAHGRLIRDDELVL